MRMFSFAGVFPSFLYNFGGNHAFEELVQREGVTLEEVLDYEGLIEEVRSHNSSFENFLTPEHCHTLLTFITEEPTDESDSKRCFKYPFVASEVLSNDLEKVINLFTKEAEFMQRLLDFLRTERINLTLAGYFSKVYTSLFNRYCHFVLASTFETSNYSKDFVRHVASRSIAEVIERILSFEEAGTKTYVEERKHLLDLLIDMIAPETEIESINASSIIVNFLSKQTSVVRWEEVASHLATSATLEKLLKHLYSNNVVVVKTLVSVLIAIITHAPLRSETQKEEEDSTIIEAESFPIIDLLNAHLNKIVETITEPRNVESNTTFKATIPVLGEDRLKLSELLAVALKLNDSSLSKRIIQEKVPSTFVKMFVEYPWNSSYHKIFESFVNTVLESNDEALKDSLLVTAELPKHLVDLSDNEKFQTNGVPIRRGNLGYVTRISNILVKNSKNDFIKQLLSKSPSWDCYVCEALRERNEIESQTIAGQKPTILSEDQFSEEEEDPKSLFGPNKNDLDDEDLEPEDEFQDNGVPMTTEELNDALFSLSDSPIKTSEVPEEVQQDMEFNANQYWRVEAPHEDLEELD
mmetsp:Transcript_7925/g.15378  ORF Transcript_7925/g.15378 Transcript_7925/m.15378 type:complete len:581 (-) Transcript_7925:1692-3434(-)